MKKLYRYPLVNIIVIALVTLFFGLQIPKITYDNDTMNFVPDDDPALTAFEDFEDQFGSALVIDLVINSDVHSIISPESLAIIQKLSDELELLKGQEKIQSITNTDYIRGKDGTLTVGPVSENEDGKLIPADTLRKRLNSWKSMYDKMLLSKDEHSTQIGITIDYNLSIEERETIYNDIQELAKKILPDGYSYYLAGLPATTIQVSENMRHDLSALIPLVSLFVLIILFISFKTIGGVVLPFLNVIISTIWTIGLMSLTGTPLTILGATIPILMVAVGSAYGIHIVSHYYDELRNPENSGMTNKEIVYKTMDAVGSPVFLAGLTTFIGFASLAVSTVVPMKFFGFFSAFGVLSALFVAFVFIPSVFLMARGTGEIKKEKQAKPERNYVFLKILSNTATKHTTMVPLVSILLAGLSIFFIPKVVVENNLIDFFKKDTEIRQADRFIRQEFAGTSSFNITIEGQEKGDLNNPEILQSMENTADYIRTNYPEVSKVISYSEYIKRINQVLNEDLPGKIALKSESNGTSDGTMVQQQEASTADSTGDNFFEDSFFGDAFGDTAIGQEEDQAAEKATSPMSTDAAQNSMPDNKPEKVDMLEALFDAYRTDPDHFIDELGRLTNYDGLDYYEIPTDLDKYHLANKDEFKNLISQYLLLYSGSLDDWSDNALEPQKARILVQLGKSGSIIASRITKAIVPAIEMMLPEGYTFTISGSSLVESSLTNLIVTSSIASIILSIILVFIILTIVYHSVLTGLIGIVPLLLTVLINMGIMGLTGIKLDISTAMVGSISIGIGIDYTIHFLSSYATNLRSLSSRDETTVKAIFTTGKAIIFNAVSVAAGFFVLTFSRFTPLIYFGILVIITMTVSSISSLILLPQLLKHLDEKHLIRSTNIKRPGAETSGKEE
ncbi:efflux RND transporter permease subunit [Sediminispirochaeta smaragdinae]|uniref:SSD domain-containing protein n=1 Tax=Sediminispirochaeta smaragdinae (strain DSM 11293 / JCM 15392 / SEBR 4228) TaxID=573413 RepID=E1R7V8_SEDSS|nr:MMPL family transporter [Sediminispirochaeta smaragdinae]ADK82813.1 conserved hypothetical protein [Sediminispirochaeta smaragdinae DSM 11293]